jgi:hypothetical protein
VPQLTDAVSPRRATVRAACHMLERAGFDHGEGGLAVLETYCAEQGIEPVDLTQFALS